MTIEAHTPVNPPRPLTCCARPSSGCARGTADEGAVPAETRVAWLDTLERALCGARRTSRAVAQDFGCRSRRAW